MFLAFERRFLSAFSSGQNHQVPKPPKQSQAAPWVTFRCVLRPPSPTQGGHFPFPREKGSENGSGQSVAGVAKKPDFLQMSG